MKTFYILIAMTIPFCLRAQFGTLPNGDFENWSLDTAFETLTQWETSNGSFVISTPTTTKETDKVSGNYSVKLSSYIIGQDSAFGYILNGHFDTLPDGGFPYTDMVDTLKGWYKYDVQNTDTALILVGIFANGTLAWQDLIPITGTQNTWMEFSFPINSPQFTPDSVFVAATSSNVFGNIMLNGSWLMLDKLSFASSQVNNPAPIPNGDFENWSYITTEEAQSWNTLNPFLLFFSVTSVKKTTDKNSGSFAVEMETYLINGGQDTVPGILTNGDVSTFGNSGGIPYTAKPDTFYGYYKYLPNGQDAGGIAIEFRNNGNVLDNQYIPFTSTANNYTSFGVSLNLSNAPDTMLVSAVSGGNPGTLLKLDDLTLAGGDVGVQPLMAEAAKLLLYPNPAAGHIWAKINLNAPSGIRLEVVDFAGKSVYAGNAGRLESGVHNINIPLDGLPAGTYLLRIAGDDETLSAPFVLH